jgi:hypothetical protein
VLALEASEFGTRQSVAPDAGYRAHVFRSGAATAPDPLCPVVSPQLCQPAEFLYLSIALPAPVDRVPRFAGIRIYDDGLACDPGQLPDEAANQCGGRAIHTDPDDLRLSVE